MRFIQVILARINKIHIVSVQIHMHGDIRVMGGIIVHQRHEQASYIDQAKQQKEKDIDVSGKDRSIQTKEFAGKVKAFLLERADEFFYFHFYQVSYLPKVFIIHVFRVRDFPIDESFCRHPWTSISTAHCNYRVKRCKFFYVF